MSDRLAVAITLVCVMGACPPAPALEFSDTFTQTHDFLLRGTAGTQWDGAMGLTGSAAEALNSSVDRPGQLYLQSAGADWNPASTTRGPFLFKRVTGDFVATVRIVDFAGTADIALPYNRAGLMIRVGLSSLAGSGEDWLALDYCPYWGLGNSARQVDNHQVTELGANRQRLAPNPFLQVERQGDLFYCRTSNNGQAWEELPGSPLPRPDMHDVAVQVGLYQATGSGQSGYAAFDDFSIQKPGANAAAAAITASKPNPGHQAGDVSQSILSWQPGQNVQAQAVYLGSTPQDLARIANALSPTRSWLVYGEGFAAGQNYYWRVDSVDATGRVYQGALWAFTAAPYQAYGPRPAPGEQDLVDKNLVMTWKPGKTAVWHDIYFSESQQRVHTGHTRAYQGRQVNVRYDPGPLRPQTTYYWRIDEIELDGQTVHRGDVWSFGTMAQIAVEDADLVGWWPFNGQSGTSVIDASGYRNHGHMLGSPQRSPGHEGLALSFDGIQDAVRCGHSKLPTGSSAFTIAAWIQPTVHNHVITSWGRPQPNQANELRLLGGQYCRHSFWDNNVDFDTGDLSGEWNHLTLAADGVQRNCYVNGSPVAGRHVGRLSGPGRVAASDLGIGANTQILSSYFAGAIDDLRIYQVKLEHTQVMRLLQANTSAALSPYPAHKSQVPFVTRLAWTPGPDAANHDLYLGLDRQAVRQAQASDRSGIFQGRLIHPYYVLPENLDTQQTYYWRVDEVSPDGQLSQGRIWSFVILPSQLLEDFEQYADYTSPRIFETWLDGLGFSDPSPGFTGNGSRSLVGYDAAPFAEIDIVHSGRQSLPLHFDNTQAPYYSQADRLFAQPQDWTGPGFTGLSLVFCGHASNRPAPDDRLYAALEDVTGRTALSHYEGDAGHYRDGNWHQWTIPFDSLSGLDWSRITSLHLGVGNPGHPTQGSGGLLFIDDIYLVQSR